jgi:hypothetical protein
MEQKRKSSSPAAVIYWKQVHDTPCSSVAGQRITHRLGSAANLLAVDNDAAAKGY